MTNPFDGSLAGKSVLVIGMGSAGMRHARLAEAMGAHVSALSRRSELADFHNVVDAFKFADWDLVIIANETSFHFETLQEIQRLGFKGKILVEKPLFSNLEGEADVTTMDNVFVAYNLRFHPVVQHARDWINWRKGKLIGASFYVGQHLSQWREGRSVPDTYSAHVQGGGGVLRDLSHELDLALWLLGDVLKTTAIGGRLSDVTIDSDDFWNILSVHQGCANVTIHLNYLDQAAQRKLKLWTAEESLEVDFLTGRLQEGLDYVSLPFEPEMTYQQQLAEVLGEQKYLATMQEGIDVLDYITAVEQAANTESWVGKSE